MKDFELGSSFSNIDHSQKMRAIFEKGNFNSKDYVDSQTSTSEFRLNLSIYIKFEYSFYKLYSLCRSLNESKNEEIGQKSQHNA